MKTRLGRINGFNDLRRVFRRAVIADFCNPVPTRSTKERLCGIVWSRAVAITTIMR
jgi:hypothetical protein